MNKVRRFGCVVKVRPEKLDYYKALHANPWPEVNAMIKACHLRNFSIYYKNGFLFSYLEYDGDDYKATLINIPVIFLTVGHCFSSSANYLGYTK